MPENTTILCPECRAGKHDNCTTQVLDADDQWELCACPVCGGGMAGTMSKPVPNSGHASGHVGLTPR